MSVNLLLFTDTVSNSLFEEIFDGGILLSRVREHLHNVGARITADVLLPDRYHALIEVAIIPTPAQIKALEDLLTVPCAVSAVETTRVFAVQAAIFAEPVRQGHATRLSDWPLGSFGQWLRLGGDGVAESKVWAAAAGVGLKTDL